MDFFEDAAEDAMSEYGDRFRKAAVARYRRSRAGRSTPAAPAAQAAPPPPPPPPPQPSRGLDSLVQQANSFLEDNLGNGGGGGGGGRGGGAGGGQGGGAGGGGAASSMMQQAMGAMSSGGAGGGAAAMIAKAKGAMGGDIKKAVSSAGFARTLVKFQLAVARATAGVASRAGSMYMIILILLLIFIIHQLFVWIDADPEIAFERASLLFDVAEVTWDMTRILWNGAVDIFNAGIIPLWNTATYYLIEPTVILALEVFSQIFMRQPWNGLMTESDFPYNGLDCMASAESAAWCGRYQFYQEQLQKPERAQAFVNESQSFARRMMLEVPDDHYFTFGLATARRLQEQSGGGFSAPSFPTGALTQALNEISVFFITMVPSLLDVVFGVLGDIIKTSFSVIMDAFFMVLKSVMFVLKMLISAFRATPTPTPTPTPTARVRQAAPAPTAPPCPRVRRERHDHHRGHHRRRLCPHSRLQPF